MKMIRCFSVTRNLKANNTMDKIMGSRIEGWMTKYENLVGLTEVKEAQAKVIEASV